MSFDFEPVAGGKKRRPPRRSTAPLVAILALSAVGLVAALAGGIYLGTQISRPAEIAPNDKKGPLAPPKTAAAASVRPRPNTSARPSLEAEPQKPMQRAASRPATPTKPAWFVDAERELAAARHGRPMDEPLEKQPLMTERDYQLANMAATAMRVNYNLEDPAWEIQQMMAAASMLSQAEPLMPRGARGLRREFLLRVARTKSQQEIDLLANNDFLIRLLLDPEIRRPIEARLPWQERRSLYREFAGIARLTEAWSLACQFDDLDGDDMGAAIHAAKAAAAEDLGALDRRGRQLLLRAGAVDFFEDRMFAWKQK